MGSPSEEQLRAIETLVDRLVQVDMGPLSRPGRKAHTGEPVAPVYPNTLRAKLDVLDHALQALRRDTHYLDNNLSLARFLGGTLSMDTGAGIRFDIKGQPGHIPEPMPARMYQPLLLVFLLLYHRRFRSVSHAAREFAERMWNELGPRDLERLRNGRFRCLTNIQFAARDLRLSFLLRFSRDEAYKTWVLSFTGFLVAARLLEKHPPWQFSNDSRAGDYGSVLHRDVFDALHTPSSFGGFARWLLHTYGTPSVGRYPTLRRVLGRAHELTSEHERILRDTRLTAPRQREQIRRCMGEFLDLPDYERFLTEFSDYMMGSTTFSAARKTWGVEGDDTA